MKIERESKEFQNQSENNDTQKRECYDSKKIEENNRLVNEE